MTPHLTISYANQSPPGTNPAGPKPAGADEAANPLGFLAALLDQLLAGATPQDQTPEIATPAAPAAPVAAVPAPAPTTGTDPVARILRVLLDDEEETAEADAPVVQMLAALGVQMPTAPAAAGAADDAAPERLARLGTQLTQISSALADTAPALATRLDAVAAALVDPDADPGFLDKLMAAATDPDPAPLDAIVRTLGTPKAPPIPTTPQIAGTTRLDLPAALAAMPPEPAPIARKTASVEAPRETVSKLTRVAATTEPAATSDAPRPDPLPARSDAAPPPQSTTTPAPAAPPPRPLPAAYQPPANPINMGQLAFEMVRQVHQGASRFTIRLDPPELGRVDVRLHVDASGAATARLTVDRAETLDLFQRDQRTLERALAQAGFDAARTSLEFSLRQDGSANLAGGQHQQQERASSPRFSLDGEREPAAPAPAITLYRGLASAGGVNIFV